MKVFSKSTVIYWYCFTVALAEIIAYANACRLSKLPKLWEWCCMCVISWLGTILVDYTEQNLGSISPHATSSHLYNPPHWICDSAQKQIQCIHVFSSSFKGFKLTPHMGSTNTSLRYITYYSLFFGPSLELRGETHSTYRDIEKIWSESHSRLSIIINQLSYIFSIWEISWVNVKHR
jgi:hypothetical protein